MNGTNERVIRSKVRVGKGGINAWLRRKTWWRNNI